MSNSAASFIDQIKAAYREVVKAETSALPHAIKCGEFLNLAKENLKAERGGNWLDWLGLNCPEIAQETASLYMRLAKHKSEVRKAKSINEARDLLPKAKRRGPAPKERGPEISNGVTNPDPAVVLQATGADEIIANIQDDTDKLEEVAKASIAKLTLDKVANRADRATSTNLVFNKHTAAPIQANQCRRRAKSSPASARANKHSTNRSKQWQSKLSFPASQWSSALRTGSSPLATQGLTITLFMERDQLGRTLSCIMPVTSTTNQQQSNPTMARHNAGMTAQRRNKQPTNNARQ
jgi:hypothetical protein